MLPLLNTAKEEDDSRGERNLLRNTMTKERKNYRS